MLPRPLLILLLVSLSLNAAFILPSCKTGPKIAVFISNPKEMGMDWSDARDGTHGFIDYGQTDKFVCVMPIDFQTLLTYCAEKGTQ